MNAVTAEAGVGSLVEGLPACGEGSECFPQQEFRSLLRDTSGDRFDGHLLVAAPGDCSPSCCHFLRSSRRLARTRKRLAWELLSNARRGGGGRPLQSDGCGCGKQALSHCVNDG